MYTFKCSIALSEIIILSKKKKVNLSRQNELRTHICIF